MTDKYILFDMDGVLLTHNGYHQSLQSSISRIGLALGAPLTFISNNQISHFEALNITNEFDTLAICTALLLIQAWKFDETIRLEDFSPNPVVLTRKAPDFDSFLALFSSDGGMPGKCAYQQIITENPTLSDSQKSYLSDILLHSRDIHQSTILQIHQETVLGSQLFQEYYNLNPQLNTESYLLTRDKPNLTKNNLTRLKNWLNKPNNHATIMTNRPSRTPEDYLSSPEAEIGAKLVGLEDLPIIGSGLLAWFAVTKCQLPDHTLLKPNPVHALAGLQSHRVQSLSEALKVAFDLWQGNGDPQEWEFLEDATITIFEDAANGLKSGIAACDLLKNLGISTKLNLIGVSDNPIKRKALKSLANRIISNLNQMNWDTI